MDKPTIVALVLSALSLVVALRSDRSSKRSAIAAEDANRMTRETLRAAEVASTKADVRVVTELRRNSYGTWHVVVQNKGLATATNVSVEIIASEQSKLDLFVGRDRSVTKAELAPGETSSLPLMNHVDGKDCPIAGNLLWTDTTSHHDKFTITQTAEHGPYITPEAKASR